VTYRFVHPHDIVEARDRLLALGCAVMIDGLEMAVEAPTEIGTADVDELVDRHWGWPI